MADRLYGIRIIVTNWATVDGGADSVGTLSEMEELAARWRSEARPEHDVRFEVVPYTGNDAVD